MMKRQSQLSDDDSDSEVPEKKTKATSNVGWNIMKNMGYEGKGLGAQNQGRTEPVMAHAPSNRRGLGITDIDLGVEKPDTVWKPGLDEASADGEIIFKFKSTKSDPAKMDLVSGKMIGERRDNIKDETTYCDEKLLHEMLKCKSVLNKYDNFNEARSRCNPYEKINCGIFLNRAAMKMLDMDYLFDGLFTETKEKSTLFFADICAGPGGFTEYILWKRPLSSVGFGFTLREMNDFKLRDILAGPVQCFHPSYGKHGDGDITKEANILKFQSEIMESTNNEGVHTVMGDGGFSVSGNESIQEILSKQLYLCQFLCAIYVLRHGGNFVCKLFDTFTDFSIGLIYLMRTLFSEIAIIKPITSRPANSERYILFKDFTDSAEQINSLREYLTKINIELTELSETNQDIIKLIPQLIINRDFHFCQFIKEANNAILRQQIIHLAKLHAFIQDRNLVDNRQADIRNELYKRWGIENLSRETFTDIKPIPAIKSLIKYNYRDKLEEPLDPIRKPIKELTKEEMMKPKFVFRNMYGGFIGPPDSVSGNMQISHSSQSNNTTSQLEPLYLVVRDKRNVLLYDSIDATSPSKFTDTFKKWNLFIPQHTVILVNFCVTYSGIRGNMRHNTTIIVDAAMIYGEDLTELSYDARMLKVKNLCRLLDPKRKGIIRPLDYFHFIMFPEFLHENIMEKKVKGGIEQKVVRFRDTQHQFIQLYKLIFINFTNCQWMLAESRKGYTYYFNVLNKQSQVEIPRDLYADYAHSHIFKIQCKGMDDEFSCSTIMEKWAEKTQ